MQAIDGFSKEIKSMGKIVFVGIWILSLFSRMAFADELISPRVQTVAPKPFFDSAVEEGGIYFGPNKEWWIRPGFEFKTAFDSNVNREPGGKTDSDVILSFIPSVELSRKGTYFGVESNYKMSYEQFLRDADQSAFNHQFREWAYFTGEKLTIKVGEEFGWTRTYATSEQNERRAFVYNYVFPEVIYKITPKTSISALYGNYVLNYRDSILRDSSYVTNDIGGRLYYHTTPRLDLYLQGSAKLVSYYRSDLLDSKGFGIYVGSLGHLTEKTVLNLQTGFQGRVYDNSTINSYNNWAGEAVLQYSLTAKTDLKLEAKRGIEESVYQNAGWYGVHRFGFGIDYQMAYKTKLETKVAYQNNRYPRETTEGIVTKKRRDHLVIADAKLTWTPYHFIQVAIGYVFQVRQSNFEKFFNYVDHVAEASSTLKF